MSPLAGWRPGGKRP